MLPSKHLHKRILDMQEYTITLDGNKLNYILSLLSGAPWRDANPIIQSIDQQIAARNAPPEGPAEAAQDGIEK